MDEKMWPDEDFSYPHGEKYPLNAVAPGLYIKLWNGRREHVAVGAFEDCGFDGPVVGPLEYVGVTYAAEIKFEPADGYSISRFFPEGHGPDIRGGSLYTLRIDKDGYVEHDDCCYGDWTIFCHNGGSA